MLPKIAGPAPISTIQMIMNIPPSTSEPEIFCPCLNMKMIGVKTTQLEKIDEIIPGLIPD
jgi:hypothetical protein